LTQLLTEKYQMLPSWIHQCLNAYLQQIQTDNYHKLLFLWKITYWSADLFYSINVYMLYLSVNCPMHAHVSENTGTINRRLTSILDLKTLNCIS